MPEISRVPVNLNSKQQETHQLVKLLLYLLLTGRQFFCWMRLFTFSSALRFSGLSSVTSVTSCFILSHICIFSSSIRHRIVAFVSCLTCRLPNSTLVNYFSIAVFPVLGGYFLKPNEFCLSMSWDEFGDALKIVSAPSSSGLPRLPPNVKSFSNWSDGSSQWSWNVRLSSKGCWGTCLSPFNFHLGKCLSFAVPWLKRLLVLTHFV